MSKVIETIKKQALMEDSILKKTRLGGNCLGKKGGLSLIKTNIDFQPMYTKHIMSIDEEPVSLDTFVSFDPKIVATAGWFNIKYCPKNSPEYKKGKPYRIGQDLVRMPVCVSGYNHWRCLSKRIPELGLIERWCPMLTASLFGIAKMHPGTSFFFTFDWVGYANMISEKAKKKKIDINHKPFVAYRTNLEQEAKWDEQYKVSLPRTRKFYEKEIREAEREPEAIEEMRRESL